MPKHIPISINYCSEKIIIPLMPAGLRPEIMETDLIPSLVTKMPLNNFFCLCHYGYFSSEGL